MNTSPGTYRSRLRDALADASVVLAAAAEDLTGSDPMSALAGLRRTVTAAATAATARSLLTGLELADPGTEQDVIDRHAAEASRLAFDAATLRSSDWTAMPVMAARAVALRDLTRDTATGTTVMLEIDVEVG